MEPFIYQSRKNGSVIYSFLGKGGLIVYLAALKRVPIVPLVKTVGSQYCRQSTVWAKLPTLESHNDMIQYGVLNFKINFTYKHCYYSDDIVK